MDTETETLVRGDDADNDWRRRMLVDIKLVLGSIPTLVNSITKE